MEHGCYFFMTYKFFSIIKSNRVDYQTFHHGIKSSYNLYCIFPIEVSEQNEFLRNINTTQDYSLILGSNDCISFPIANTYFLLNNLQAFRKIYSSWNAASTCFLPIESFFVVFTLVS